MSEISQKAFFLESDKKNLTDKVMMLQAALKVARELKDKAANERVQKMEKENLALQVSSIIILWELTSPMLPGSMVLVRL